MKTQSFPQKFVCGPTDIILFYFILFYFILSNSMSFHLIVFYCIPFHFILSHLLSFQFISFLSYFSFPGKGGKPATVPRTYAAAYIFLGFSRFGRPQPGGQNEVDFKRKSRFSNNRGGSRQYGWSPVSRWNDVWGCDANEILVSPRRPGSLSVRDARLFCELFFGSWAAHFPDFLGGLQSPQILRFRFSREQKASRSGCH
jgi:hypothetical protein